MFSTPFLVFGCLQIAGGLVGFIVHFLNTRINPVENCVDCNKTSEIVKKS